MEYRLLYCGNMDETAIRTSVVQERYWHSMHITFVSFESLKDAR
jgi:hypothetical protein